MVLCVWIIRCGRHKLNRRQSVFCVCVRTLCGVCAPEDPHTQFYCNDDERRFKRAGFNRSMVELKDDVGRIPQLAEKEHLPNSS